MSKRPPLRVLPSRPSWPPSFLPEAGRKITEAVETVTNSAQHSPGEVMSALAEIVSAAVSAELEMSRYRKSGSG